MEKKTILRGALGLLAFVFARVFAEPLVRWAAIALVFAPPAERLLAPKPGTATADPAPVAG